MPFGISQGAFLNATQLGKALQEEPLPKLFFDQMFFSNHQKIRTSTARYDEERGSSRIAPYVSSEIGSQTVAAEPRRVEAVKTVLSAPSMTITMAQIEEALESILPWQVGDWEAILQELQVRNLALMINRHMRLWERQAVDLTSTGQTSLTGLGLPADLKVDLWATPAMVKPETVLTGDDRWGEADADPVEDLNAAKLSIPAQGGSTPDVAIFGSNAIKAFISSEKFREVRSDRARGGIVEDSEVLPNGAVYHGMDGNTGLGIYSYSGFYTDQNDVDVPYLDPDSVVLGNSRGASSVRVFTPVTGFSGEDAREWRFPNGEFNIYTYVQRAPKEGMTTAVKSRTLPVLKNIYDFWTIRTRG